MSYDWELIDRIGRDSRIVSLGEIADREHLKALRDEVTGGPVSRPLVEWTMSKGWTNPERYASTFHGMTYRGTAYRSGNNGIPSKYDRGIAIGEIDGR